MTLVLSGVIYAAVDITNAPPFQIDLLFVRQLQGIQIVTYKSTAATPGNITSFTLSYGQSEAHLIDYREISYQIKVQEF